VNFKNLNPASGRVSSFTRLPLCRFAEQRDSSEPHVMSGANVMVPPVGLSIVRGWVRTAIGGGVPSNVAPHVLASLTARGPPRCARTREL
jgi:hypothetical protein